MIDDATDDESDRATVCMVGTVAAAPRRGRTQSARLVCVLLIEACVGGRTHRYDVIVRRDAAAWLASIEQGARVRITGALTSRSTADADGWPRRITEIDADAISVIRRGDDDHAAA